MVEGKYVVSFGRLRGSIVLSLSLSVRLYHQQTVSKQPFINENQTATAILLSYWQ